MKINKIIGLWVFPIGLVLVGSLFAKKSDINVDHDYIAQQVAKAINANVDRTLKAHEPKVDLRQMHKNRGYEESGKTIYLLPYWPFYTTYFDDNDLITAYASFTTASQSYSGHGGSKNLSTLIFGEQPLTIKDMLLASKLSYNGLVQLSGQTPEFTKQNYYFSILGDQQVHFDATLNQGQVALSYARHFHKGDFALGFYLPVKIRGQRLHITNDMTVENRRRIEQAVLANPGVPELNFFAQYNDLNDFVTEIINQKGMGFSHKSTTVGLGDVMVYCNLDIPTRHISRFVTGLSVLIPTARERDTAKIWDAELGNGGFVEGSWFGSMVWEQNRWFNPYIHTTATYRFESNVYRRLPRYNGYNSSNGMFNDILVGVPPAPTKKGGVVMGEALDFVNTFEQLPDSTIRNFADESHKVKVAPGAELFCRLGNTFDAIFSNHGFFDIYYDLHLKGKDYITHRQLDDVYIPGILNHNSWLVSHTLGGNYSYQFDESFRLRLGLWYVVAGRNTPQTFGAELGFNAEF